MKARFIILSLGLLTAIGSGAQTPLPTLAEAARTRAEKLTVGAIVTAEEIGGEAHYAGAGKLEPGGVPPEKLIFEIGSISKVFTSVLLAHAVLDNKVDLDATVGALLGPEAKFADARVAKITLRQLATHTSGLPRLPANMATGSNPADPYRHYDLARLMTGIAQAQLKGDGPFQLSYSNFAVGLLGQLLARSYGQTWPELVAEKITGPLKMTDTAVTLTPEQTARLTPPYAGPKPAHYWDLNALIAAGGLHSTAQDLVKFGAALLKPDKTPLGAAISLIEQPQLEAGQIGLGIFRSKYADHLTFQHDGGTGGFRTLLEVCPDAGSVRVVLCNNSQLSPHEITAATRPKPPAPVMRPQPLSEDALQSYPGVYQAGEQQRFTLVRRGAELWVRLTGQPFFRLFPEEAPDHFFYRAVPARIEFQRQAGAISGLTLLQDGGKMSAKRSGPSPAFLFPKAEELREYTGRYMMFSGHEFILTVEANTLYAKLGEQPASPVFATRRDYFEYDVVEAALEFDRDSAGVVTGLKLHQNGAVQPAGKVK